MARGRTTRACAAWGLAALLSWSCSSGSPSPGPSGSGGTSSGLGGEPANGGGGTSDTGGATSLSGSGQGGGAGTSSGTGGSAGTSEGGSSPLPVGGEGGAGAGGVTDEGGAGMGGADGGEGGAGGSGDALFDGRCGRGWAAPGASAPPELTGDVTPEADKSGNYSFSFGRYRFVVAAARGGRIVELSIDGVNLLDPSAGSTFWPSPQQAYAWPPPVELDSSAYQAEVDGTTLSLTSSVATSLGLRVRKRFWVNAGSGVVTIEYRLSNEAKKSASWAPWEVTRVRAGGYTFAPRGPGSRTITQDSWQHPLPLKSLPDSAAPRGVQWLDYPGTTLTEDNYIAEFDGAEGWLAHANRLGRPSLALLLVKSFVDAPDSALPENQAEIQLWTSGTANPKLIEVEEQGAEQQLLPGKALTWTVHWSACELDPKVTLSAGSEELVALARAHAVTPEAP